MNKQAYFKLMGLNKKAEDKKPVLTNPGVGYGPVLPKGPVKFDPNAPSILQLGRAINADKTLDQLKEQEKPATVAGLYVPKDYKKTTEANQKFGPPEKYLYNKLFPSIKGLYYSNPMEWAAEEDRKAAEINKNTVPYKVMKALAKKDWQDQIGVRTQQGANSVFDYDYFNKIKGIPEASKDAFKANLSKFLSYKNKGWFERFIEWIKQKLAADPSNTVRGRAFSAGANADTFYSKLPETLRKSLQK